MDTTKIELGDAVLVKRISNPKTKQYWATVIDIIAIGFKVARIPLGTSSNSHLPTWIYKEEVIDHRSNRKI